MNLLTLIPARYRKYAYASLSVAAVIVGAIQVSHGDPVEAAAYVLGALGFTTAVANTNAE